MRKQGSQLKRKAVSALLVIAMCHAFPYDLNATCEICNHEQAQGDVVECPGQFRFGPNGEVINCPGGTLKQCDPKPGCDPTSDSFDCHMNNTPNNTEDDVTVTCDLYDRNEGDTGWDLSPDSPDEDMVEDCWTSCPCEG